MPDDSLTQPSASATGALAGRYLDALLAADAAGAQAAVSDALTARLPLSDLLLGVVAPAMREVGDRWHRGQLSVAQEHWASETTRAQLARLQLGLAPRARLSLDAIVATPQGERHDLGARVLGLLLAARGWTVDVLGADLPPDDLASWVAARRPHLVCLSVTLREHVPAAANAVAALQLLSAPPRVLLGGAGFGSPPQLPAGFPADVSLSDGSGAVAEAERILGRAGAPDLATYLATVGGRIQALRRERGMSQSELGRAADLTRSYLSAVEQGRQNITLEAALRLAVALRVGVGELLRETPA